MNFYRKCAAIRQITDYRRTLSCSVLKKTPLCLGKDLRFNALKMSYDREVEELLGKKVLQLICNYVADAKIDGQKMKEFAKQLGPVSFGKHKTRTEQRRNSSNQPEMRNILSDWYNKELHNLDQVTAVSKLANIFEGPDVYLPHLQQL